MNLVSKPINMCTILLVLSLLLGCKEEPLIPDTGASLSGKIKSIELSSNQKSVIKYVFEYDKEAMLSKLNVIDNGKNIQYQVISDQTQKIKQLINPTAKDTLKFNYDNRNLLESIVGSKTERFEYDLQGRLT